MFSRDCAVQDLVRLAELSRRTDAPLPWIPAAVKRWLQEQPAPHTGLGRLEWLALEAIRSGCETPAEIFATVAAADTPPQYWGDTTLWAKINALADAHPPAGAHRRAGGKAAPMGEYGGFETV